MARITSVIRRAAAAVPLFLLCLGLTQAAEPAGPWPAPVPGWAPVQPGEHPRLFFRKADLPELKKRAETPEGKAILARLKVLLGGGEAMPTAFMKTKKAYEYKGEPLPVGAYTLWHGAGFGLLYQLSGDKKFAELGKECVAKALAGQRDRDDRYSFVSPGGALRAGPSISAIAMAYDLCYDGWDEPFRTYHYFDVTAQQGWNTQYNVDYTLRVYEAYNKSIGTNRAIDCLTPTKKYHPLIVSDDQFHPNAAGHAVFTYCWFEALLKHDGLEAPPWCREEVEVALEKQKQQAK